MTPQTNGQAKDDELWTVVKGFAEGKKVSPGVRDKVLFGAMGDLRTRIGAVETRLGKIWPVYQTLALLWVPVVGGIIIALVTGKLVISRTP